MTVLQTHQRTPSKEKVAVRVVDSDIHPMPRAGALIEHIPEPFRSRFTYNRQANYDAPDYAYSFAMRMDTFPADGQFPGSDPELAFKQVIMEAGSDIGILEPVIGADHYLPEVAQ